MMKALTFRFLAPLVCVCAGLTMAQSGADKANQMLVRKDMPSVYVVFERRGTAPPLFENEMDDRIWAGAHGAEVFEAVPESS
jgi:hypothetical protein